MGTVFLTNLAGRKVRMIWHFVHHIGFQDPQPFTFKKKLQLLKTLKKTLFICVLLFVCLGIDVVGSHILLMLSCHFANPILSIMAVSWLNFNHYIIKYHSCSTLDIKNHMQLKPSPWFPWGPGKYNPNIMTVKNPLPTNFKHLLVSLFFCTLHRFFEKSQITLRCFVITSHYMFLS